MRSRGQSVLEMALVLPLFVLLLIAVADVCFLLMRQYELNLAAADVARAGSQRLAPPDDGALFEMVRQRLGDEIGSISSKVSRNPDGTGSCDEWRGCYYSVRLEQPVPLLLPVGQVGRVPVSWPVGTDSEGRLLLSASATFRVGLYRVVIER
jgi:hypothetical protein